nr:hypothetical protein [Tanacetum cinerariifolium]
DPRVPLILGRPFLSTAHAIINVHEREIILRQDQQSLTIQCGDISSIKKVEQIHKIDFINASESDSEEIENFLNDDSIPLRVEDSPFNMEEDILFLESLLIEDPFLLPPIIPNQTKSPMEEPKHSFNMGYEHFSTNLVTNEVAESSTKNLVPIPRESKVTLEPGGESIEPIKDNSLVFTTFSNPLFDNDKINSDEINSHVESNSVESTSNHDTVKFDNLDEFYGPLIPIHIVEEERTRREHADYINRMKMLFTINPRPHPTLNANTNVKFFSSFPIPVQDNDSQQEEIDINSNFTIISNPPSDVESNSDESISNHNTVKSDYLDEFYGPFIPIHILEEERTRREHAYYINRMEMLFTINPRPHNSTNDITNVKPFSSFPIPNQESDPHQEEIDVVSVTNDVLPPSDDDSDEEVDDVCDPLPLPPSEPPDKEFDFEKQISVVRNVIVKFDVRVKFNVFNDENDVFMFIIFAKKFSLLSAESEDTIFDPGISDWIQ